MERATAVVRQPPLRPEVDYELQKDEEESDYIWEDYGYVVRQHAISRPDHAID
jgi:hypothetical protein